MCESFRATSNARVVLVARDGHVLACAGEQSSAATAAPAFLSLPAATHATGHEPPDAWEMESGDAIHQTRVKRALLVVRFHRDETSLGLIRLRARRAIEQLERLLDDDEAPEMPPIGGQGGGPSGVPNELRVVEPVPAERPKPRPKPIGRKKRGG